MPIGQQVIIGIFILAAVLIAIKLFTAQIRWVLKIIINIVLGFISLLLFNLVGMSVGITVGVNLLNSIIIGLLGLPGFGLVLMLKWLFAI